MKNKIIKFLQLFSIVGVLFLFGCSGANSGIDAQVKICSLPWNAKGLTAEIWPINAKNEQISTITLGTLEEDSTTFDVSFPGNTDSFLVLLLDSHDDISYYIRARFYGNNPFYEVNGYWCIYDNIDIESLYGPYYATSPDYFSELTLDNNYYLDYEKAPFHLYTVSNAKDQKYFFSISNNYSDIYATNDINVLLKQTYSDSDKMEDKEIFTSTEDKMYIMVRPYSYYYDFDYDITFSVSNITGIENRTLVFDSVAKISDTELLFTETEDYYGEGSYSLYKYDITTKKLTHIKKFSKKISHIEKDNNNDFYISTGVDIYLYKPSTDEVNYKFTVEGSYDIHTFCIAGDYMLVNLGYFGDTYLYNLSDFSDFKKTSISNDTESFIYISEIPAALYKNGSYIYYIDLTHNDLDHLDLIDVKNLSYSSFIRRFGNEKSFIDSTGRLYNFPEFTNGRMNIATSQPLEITFDDILFDTDGDYFYIFTNDSINYSSTIKKYSYNITRDANEKISTISISEIKSITIDNEKGRKLMPTADGIMLVSTSPNTVYGTSKYAIYVHKFDGSLNETTNTTPGTTACYYNKYFLTK